MFTDNWGSICQAEGTAGTKTLKQARRPVQGSEESGGQGGNEGLGHAGP